MEDQKVIATAALISVGVGSANSIFKYKKAPSTKFLIGSGVAFLLLSGMANSQALAEVAKGLALGIMTTILLGDGGGVLTYFAGEKETDTRAPKSKGTVRPKEAAEYADSAIQLPRAGGQTFRLDNLTPFPGVTTK